MIGRAMMGNMAHIPGTGRQGPLDRVAVADVASVDDDDEVDEVNDDEVDAKPVKKAAARKMAAASKSGE